MLRPITILAICQTLLAVIGYLALNGIMKLGGYPDDWEGTIEWSKLAASLKNHGMWLIAVPLIWSLIALWAERSSAITRLPWSWVTGGLIIALIVLLYGWSMLHPYRRLHLFEILEKRAAEKGGR